MEKDEAIRLQEGLAARARITAQMDLRPWSERLLDRYVEVVSERSSRG
jgi:hypothetical protein